MPVRPAAIAVALALAACASLAEQERPALLSSPGADSHAELVKAVSTALGVTTVTIARDALTREALLVIERKPARDASGQRLSGRDLDKPEQFQLVKKGAACMLLHLRTGQRYPLTHGRCAAEPSEISR